MDVSVLWSVIILSKFKHTTIVLHSDLLVVAFFPFKNTVPARIQAPLHTVEAYFAPGAWFLRNSTSDGSTLSGAARMPFRKKKRTQIRSRLENRAT